MSRSIGELREQLRAELRKAPFAPSSREALLLLSHVLDLDEAQVLAHPERLVSESDEASLLELLSRRVCGEPIAYLFGEKEFWGRSFFVDRRVLIPRPETEHLVEAVLALDLPDAPRLLEIGTGSGCVAVTLALEIAKARVTASDISLPALRVARRNAARHGCSIRFVLGDLLAALRPGCFDAIVCNPPYIAESERASLSPEILDYEPETALFSGPEGLNAYQSLFSEIGSRARGVPILIEIGAAQTKAIQHLARHTNLDVQRKIRDHEGFDRVLVVTSNSTDTA